MEKNTRNFLEYLFPMIDDKRKYERLVHARIRPAVVRGDIRRILESRIKNSEMGLTEDEYRIAYAPKYAYDPESFIEHFSQEDGIFLLQLTVEWNDSLLDRLADFIAKNPTSLPFFLQYNVLSIFGLMLGNFCFFNEIYSILNTTSQQIWWKNSYNDLNKYAHLNFLGKYRLSLFLAVIDRLLERKINLGSFHFTMLDYSTTFENISHGQPWFETILDFIPEEGYQRLDGVVFSKEEVVELTSFDTLDGFLKSISKLVSKDHLYAYNEGTMLDPKKIRPAKTEQKYMNNQVLEDIYADEFPADCKVNIQECCEAYREKLKNVNLIIHHDILNRELDRLRSALELQKDRASADLSQLNSQFQAVYDKIKMLPSNLQTSLLDNINSLISQGKIDIVTEAAPSIESRLANIEQKIETFDKKITSLDVRVSSLEDAMKSIYDYIENGTPLPAEVSKFITKKDLGKLSFYPTKTKNATLRKAVVMGALLLNALPLLSLSSSDVLMDAPKPIFQAPPSIISQIDRSKPEIPVEIPNDDDQSLNDDESTKGIKIYAPISGSNVYYTSIYDKEPLGTTNQNGIIIRYYVLHDGQCVARFVTQEEIDQFIKEQGENVRSFVWKAAICSLKNEIIDDYVDTKKAIPAEYTTFFTDYEPSLDYDFDQQDPTI